MPLVGDDFGVVVEDGERVLSCDLTLDGAWVVAVDDGTRTILRFSSGAQAALRRSHRCLEATWIGDDEALVVVPRTRGTEPNAWLQAPGRPGRRWFVGDAVSAVVRLGDDLVAVTYFDEGSGKPVSEEGVAVFTLDGTFRRGYLSSSGVPVMDCYAAVAVGPRTVAFWSVESWRLTEWDVVSGNERRHVVPGTVRGAGAISQRGDRWWFFSPYGHRRMLFEWRAGSSKVTRVGMTDGPLRGLPGGRFVDLSGDSPTLLTMPLVDR